MSAHNGMTFRILAALTEPKSAPQIALEIGEPTSLVVNRLKDLSTRHFVERMAEEAPRVRKTGRVPHYWRKLTDHQTQARKRFESARRVVEAAGYILVPRRG